MKTIKHISDAMLVLAFVFLGVAVLGPSWAWWVSLFCLVDAVAATMLLRRKKKANRAAA